MDYTSNTTAVCQNCYKGIYRRDEEKHGFSHYVWYHMNTLDRKCQVSPEAVPLQGTMSKAIE